VLLKYAPTIYVVIACLLVIGCGGPQDEAPVTFPVTGTVKTEQGAMMPSGNIEFRNVANPSLTTVGTITAGKFTLGTIFDTGKVDGAPPGEYEVTITPLSQNDQQEGVPQPVVISKHIHVNEGENDIELTLPSAAENSP